MGHQVAVWPWTHPISSLGFLVKESWVKLDFVQDSYSIFSTLTSTEYLEHMLTDNDPFYQEGYLIILEQGSKSAMLSCWQLL